MSRLYTFTQIFYPEILRTKIFKYIINFCKWNDYGYYTRYDLYLVVPEGEYNYFLARVIMFDEKGSSNVKILQEISLSTLTFIESIEDAYRIFLYLKPSERYELIDLLNIKFEIPNEIQILPEVYNSLLRYKNINIFINEQHQIKNIVTSKMDLGHILSQKVEINNLYEYYLNNKYE